MYDKGLPPAASTSAVERQARRTSRRLESALRSGPFEYALQVAIEESGLSLESIRRRLNARGIRVGLSTLSYWQRGRRRPERAESMRAVLAIEDLLGLSFASLMALLGPPKPRGRWAEPQRRTNEKADILGEAIIPMGRLLDEFGADVNTQVQQISVHAERWMRANRAWNVERIRRVVTSSADGVDRFVAVNLPDTPDEQPPMIRAVHGCRLGRVRADPTTGMHAAELIFESRLEAGESHVFDYEYRPANGTTGVAQYQYGSRTSLRELVLRAHFDPSALPARCYRMRQPHIEGDPQRCDEIQPGTRGVFQVVSLDTQPGFEGFCWEWD